MEHTIISAMKKLFEIDNEVEEMKNGTRLIFPTKKENKKKEQRRVCEQEARLLLCQEMNCCDDKYYSIETPTIGKYSFSGKKKLSGNLDVCVYGLAENRYVRKHNIEFKAHNMHGSYKNDFVKLLEEKGDTNYLVHILPSVNNGTLYCKEGTKRSGFR